MNNPHQNARSTRLGRAEMIRRIIEDGQPVREVARGFGISERTARKWLARYRAEGSSGLDNRSSRPRTGANRTLPVTTILSGSVSGRERAAVRACAPSSPPAPAVPEVMRVQLLPSVRNGVMPQSQTAIGVPIHFM
jgi:transposase-like protein